MKIAIVKQRYNNFTLVEIMVTMAILVVMMGFLFQFVIGAQKIWSGTTKNLEMFEQAQIIFNVMETDLKNMVWENPKENPDAGILAYLDTVDSDANRLKDLCFMTSYNSNSDNDDNIKKVGFYSVYYQLVPIEKDEDENPTRFLLYRYNIDEKIDSYDPYFLYGNEITISSSNYIKGQFEGYRTKILNLDEEDPATVDNLREILSEDIETLKVQVFPDDKIGHLLNKKPISFKVTLKLRQKQKKNAEVRTFSKVIFVD